MSASDPHTSLSDPNRPDPAQPDVGRISRRSLAIGVAFALTAGAAAAVTPRRHEQTLGGARLAAVIPDHVGPWSAQTGGAFVLPQSDQPDSVYDQVLTRDYAAAGQPPIMLLIAYGAAQSGLMKVHRPEVCYASSGFSVHDYRPEDVQIGGGVIAADTFLAKRSDRVEQVLYWTRISNAFPRDLNAQRLLMLERGLQGVIPDGVLVRLSTLGGDTAAGGAAMATFAKALVASADPRGRALLVGDLAARAAPQGRS